MSTDLFGTICAAPAYPPRQARGGPPTVITLFVPGIPRPGGSKTATLIRRKGGAIVMKNGRPLITTRDDAKGNKEWRATVAYFARSTYEGNPIDATLAIEVVFTMPRLKSHFRSNGELKPNAPVFHDVRPDASKLWRSTEDALTGVLWRDDATIAIQNVTKVYGDKPGAKIMVRVIERSA